MLLEAWFNRGLNFVDLFDLRLDGRAGGDVAKGAGKSALLLSEYAVPFAFAGLTVAMLGATTQLVTAYNSGGGGGGKRKQAPPKTKEKKGSKKTTQGGGAKRRRV